MDVGFVKGIVTLPFHHLKKMVQKLFFTQKLLLHLTKRYKETASIHIELNVIVLKCFILLKWHLKKKLCTTFTLFLFVPNLDALLIQNLLTFTEQRHCSLPQIVNCSLNK